MSIYFRLHVRDSNRALFCFGRLTLQYIVDMASKVITQRLLWQRLNQNTIRAEQYQGQREFYLCTSVQPNTVVNSGAHDAVVASDHPVSAASIGRRIVLPSSVKGSPRKQHQLYLDGMAITCKYGSPSAFITITCNPAWKEITGR